jgi:hypothetical protein
MRSADKNTAKPVTFKNSLRLVEQACRIDRNCVIAFGIDHRFAIGHCLSHNFERFQSKMSDI